SRTSAIFFQAEDGIRDRNVTGVQTCALPISIVVLMGVQHIASIAEALIDHGRSKETPVAVTQDATLPTQRTVTGTLATIAAAARSARVRPPAVVIIGEVVKTARELDILHTGTQFDTRRSATRHDLR